MQVTKDDTYQGLASDLQSLGVFHNGRDGIWDAYWPVWMIGRKEMDISSHVAM